MSTPAGWYDDGKGSRRWWDGSQWTEHVQPPAASVAPAEPTATADAVPGTADDVAAPATTDDVAHAPSVQAPAPAAPAHSATSPYQAAPGYPPGPGYPPASDYPPAPARSSRKWVLWVVIGVVALMIVGGALFFIITSLVGVIQNSVPIPPASQPSASAPSDSTPDAGPTDENITELDAAERTAAEDLVQRYDRAWSAGDCDEYMAITTADFRTALGIEDCAALTAQSQVFNESIRDYTVTIVDAFRADLWVLVETSETGNALLDESGNPLAAPEPRTFSYYYELVEVDGAWRIDYISDAS